MSDTGSAHWASSLYMYIATSTRLLRILKSRITPVTLYWFLVASFPVQITVHPYGVKFHQQPCIGFRLRHFRCKEFYPLVLWIWNQNIAISTIHVVGTSSHITFIILTKYDRLLIFNSRCATRILISLRFDFWRNFVCSVSPAKLSSQPLRI